MSTQSSSGLAEPQLSRSDDPAKPKDDKVDLWCKWKDDEWILVAKENDDTKKITKIEIPPGNEPCRITIRLKSGNKKVVFHPTTPLWAQEGSCPHVEPADGPIATGQIVDVKRERDDKLSFTDLNEGAACTVFYALVFSDGSFLDPEIKNGGRV